MAGSSVLYGNEVRHQEFKTNEKNARPALVPCCNPSDAGLFVGTMVEFGGRLRKAIFGGW